MTNLHTVVIRPEFGTYRFDLSHFYKTLGVTTDSYGKIIIVYLQDPSLDTKEVIFNIFDMGDIVPPKLNYLGSVSPNIGQLFHVFIQGE